MTVEPTDPLDRHETWTRGLRSVADLIDRCWSGDPVPAQELAALDRFRPDDAPVSVATADQLAAAATRLRSVVRAAPGTARAVAASPLLPPPGAVPVPPRVEAPRGNPSTPSPRSGRGARPHDAPGPDALPPVLPGPLAWSLGPRAGWPELPVPLRVRALVASLGWSEGLTGPGCADAPSITRPGVGIVPLWSDPPRVWCARPGHAPDPRPIRGRRCVLCDAQSEQASSFVIEHLLFPFVVCNYHTFWK